MSVINFKSIIPPPQLKLSPHVCQQLRALGLLNLDSSTVICRNLMCEPGVAFFSQCFVSRLKIGAYSYASPGASLRNATIGRYCSIGHQVEFGLGVHEMSGVTTSPAVEHNEALMFRSGYIPPRRNSRRPDDETCCSVTLGHDIWVGCHCLFPKDVTIGHGAVIGAGSIITHDVPPYAIVAGVGGGEMSRGIIKGYRFPDEVISDLLELEWWHYDLPKMVAAGQKVPLHNIKDFIAFMRNEEREHLIPLPEAWYYLNLSDANTVQIYRVDPAQTFMGSLNVPANIAVIDDPALTQALSQLQAQTQAEAQTQAAAAAAQERARIQAQAMMLVRGAQG